MTKRRKFLLGMGSLAAGGAAAIGSGAFSTMSADRSMSVNVADDHKAYLGLDPSISEYASLQSDGSMALEFDGSNGQKGAGLNPDANTKFHNVFKVVNNGTNPVNILLTGLDTSDKDGDGVDPIAIFFTYEELTNHVVGYDAYGDSNRNDDLLWGSPNPLKGAGDWAPSGDWYMQLNPGDEAYVHMEFYLKDSYPDSSVGVKDEIPSEISLTAQGADEFTGRGIDQLEGE
ncbi:DUF1102 family [Halapricum desulfuricans]|uniref:DUF1102 family n=1 Tax=Halapricum desulfuricans TaxID=2841257 RepID=A0A897NDJ2_9EURY|nr:hypothetical protein [Halapricum desulfuricans]QSG10747.1 DUF1102 family [Halapricum desulfuricans]